MQSPGEPVTAMCVLGCSAWPRSIRGHGHGLGPVALHQTALGTFSPPRRKWGSTGCSDLFGGLVTWFSSAWPCLAHQRICGSEAGIGFMNVLWFLIFKFQ